MRVPRDILPSSDNPVLIEPAQIYVADRFFFLCFILQSISLVFVDTHQTEKKQIDPGGRRRALPFNQSHSEYINVLTRVRFGSWSGSQEKMEIIKFSLRWKQAGVAKFIYFNVFISFFCSFYARLISARHRPIEFSPVTYLLFVFAVITLSLCPKLYLESIWIFSRHISSLVRASDNSSL